MNRSFTRVSLTGLALIASATLLAGCAAAPGIVIDRPDSAGSSGDHGPVGLPVPQLGSPDFSAPARDAGSTESSGLTGSNGSIDHAIRTTVITTGWISLIADEPTAVADQAAALVASLGGRIDNRTEQSETEYSPASAQLTVRVPAADLDEALDTLKDLGTVDSASTSSTDVSTQSADLDARVAALTASVARLTSLLAQAGTVTELVELETALSSRQADLDGLIAQRDALADQVEYSTIEVQISATAIPGKQAPDSFWSGIVAGWNALWASGGVLLIAIGVVLPWIFVLGIVALVVLVIVRTATRRRRTTGPTGATAPVENTRPQERSGSTAPLATADSTAPSKEVPADGGDAAGPNRPESDDPSDSTTA
jgi:hypothetical protein